jgi:Cys-tRNA(Pro)/Cys-tRNA(Cys) deacylase
VPGIRRLGPVTETPALAAIAASGLPYRIVHFRPAPDLAEAARRRGIELNQVVKTMVVRRGEGDHLLVLVPGDRVIDWPKLRRHLGVTRLSLPDSEEALRVTGYARGVITPLGTRRPLPVVADGSILEHEEVSMASGAPGVAIHLSGADLVVVTGAEIAGVTRRA